MGEIVKEDLPKIGRLVKDVLGEDAVILSTDDSKIKVLKLATNEELVIARDTKSIVQKYLDRK